MIALCSDSRVQSLLPVGGRCPPPAADTSAGRGRRCCREWERLPTCQLVGLSICRKVGGTGCRWVGVVCCPGARASKRFWRVGFHMVDVMCGKKEPGVGSRLPLLACWIADFPTFREFGKSGRQGGVLTSGSQKSGSQKTTTEKKRERRQVWWCGCERGQVKRGQVKRGMGGVRSGGALRW